MISSNSIQNISYKTLRFLPFKTLLRYSKQNVIFPFYHLVSDNPPAHVRYLYQTISSKQFENDLDFLLKHYTPADINTVLEYIESGKKSSKPFFFLSFDDGMRECYDIVLPILKRKGIPAAFFINSSFTNNQVLFHKHKCSLLIDKLANTTTKTILIDEINNLLKTKQKDIHYTTTIIKRLNYSDQKIINKIAAILEIDFDNYLVKHRPYMSTKQIKDLAELGFPIGIHSADHPEFHLLDENSMRKQIKDSVSYLEDDLDIVKKYFAFPFTDDQVPTSFFQYLHNEKNFDLSFGTAGLKNDIETKHLQRIPMEVKGYNGASEILRMEYSYYLLKSLFDKNQLTRK